MPNRKRCGFTLVELLVVIGIIGLLISILLPSLNAARRRARLVQCLSNLRQLGIVCHIYANENRGWFPYRSESSPWPAQALWIQNGSGGPLADPTHVGDMRSMFYRYLPGYTLERGSPVMYCPAAAGSELINRYDANVWPSPTTPPTFGFYLMGYSYFGNYGNPITGRFPDPGVKYLGGTKSSYQTTLNARKLSDKPSIPLWGDCLEDKRNIGSGYAPGTYWYNAHGKNGPAQFSTVPPLGMNCVTADGSAHWYTYNQQDPAASEIEVFISDYAQGSSPGQLWGKPMP